MSPNANYGVNLSAGGVSLQSTIIRSGEHPNSYEVPLPMGKAGTLTTRTDANTGTATLGAGHGINTAMTADVHFANGVRYGVTIGTVSGNTVPFSVGAGDPLPVANSALVVAQQVSVNTVIDGDNLKIIGIGLQSQGSGGKGHLDMRAGNTTIQEFDLVANEPQIYDVQAAVAQGKANPFTGNNITSSLASNGSSTANATLKIVAMEDATP